MSNSRSQEYLGGVDQVIAKLALTYLNPEQHKKVLMATLLTVYIKSLTNPQLISMLTDVRQQYDAPHQSLVWWIPYRIYNARARVPDIDKALKELKESATVEEVLTQLFAKGKWKETSVNTDLMRTLIHQTPDHDVEYVPTLAELEEIKNLLPAAIKEWDLNEVNRRLNLKPDLYQDLTPKQIEELQLILTTNAKDYQNTQKQLAEKQAELEAVKALKKEQKQQAGANLLSKPSQKGFFAPSYQPPTIRKISEISEFDNVRSQLDGVLTKSVIVKKHADVKTIENYADPAPNKFAKQRAQVSSMLSDLLNSRKSQPIVMQELEEPHELTQGKLAGFSTTHRI